MTFQKLTGYVNHTYLFHAVDDVDAIDGVVVRLYETTRDSGGENDKYDELIFMQVSVVEMPEDHQREKDCDLVQQMISS